jgi:hypothetical protein
MVNGAEITASISDALRTHLEWLAVYAEGRTFPLLAEEIEIEELPGRTLIGMHGDKGWRTWRVHSSRVDEGELHLELSGSFGTERQNVRLVPRTPAAELSREVELARMIRVSEIAKLVETNFTGTKVTRAGLNESNGRMAQIICESPQKTQWGVIADVTDSLTPESLMASASLWLDRLNARRKKPIGSVWIAAERKLAKSLRRLHTLLNRSAKAVITIVEVNGEEMRPLDEWPLSALWREKPKKLSIPSEIVHTKTARAIIGIDPEKIDVVRSKQGETLRFLGLPFARVRAMMGREAAWLGTRKTRRPLNLANEEELRGLIDEMSGFRRPDTPNPRHEFYRASPEWWLESILRRNIQLLDANLVLSPIYNQFRSSTDKIDLLALRRDGRLVIVELKTSPDREMVLQAADYWRKIELQRRRGVLAKARLFGDREILDEPALVYAVAPALSFQRDFEYFARKLAPEIELWRFELHEAWRNEVKVIARREYR